MAQTPEDHRGTDRHGGHGLSRPGSRCRGPGPPPRTCGYCDAIDILFCSGRDLAHLGDGLTRYRSRRAESVRNHPGRGGSRADIITLVRPSEMGLTVINLPRDLTINSKGMELDRLATTYVPGPQNTVNALCTGLGIPTTHLVTIDMAQFATIIDSLGGVEVGHP